MIQLPFLLPTLLLLPFLPMEGPSIPAELEECTAGVASGRATADGRPLLWKTRDAGAINNEVIWNTSGAYPFVSVISAGAESSSWMGVNEKGFAIINTASSDLPAAPSGLSNGQFMAYALQRCATVEEFEDLLQETNQSGRRTNTNFGVIDATGAAAFFETAGHQYWRYDAADTEKGYILRTNFAVNGDRSRGDPPGSMDRYLQTEQLMIDFYRTDKIDFKEIVKVQVRSFGTPEGELIQLPFTGSIDGHPAGYFPHNSSINRNTSVSFAVIQGVLEGEDPRLSTMWTILGQPSTGVLVPYWPVGETPPEANGPETAPMADASNQIRKELYEEFEDPSADPARIRPLYIDTSELKDEDGGGIWKMLMPLEDSIITASEARLESWRASGPDIEEMLQVEGTMAARALAGIKKAYEYLIRLN
ncbi:MAG: carcinine hydrolase/isopenicillin-N N-acyltransferase family protein [Gemmatimonadota bacterium]|jgi:hypothetical protein